MWHIKSGLEEEKRTIGTIDKALHSQCISSSGVEKDVKQKGCLHWKEVHMPQSSGSQQLQLGYRQVHHHLRGSVMCWILQERGLNTSNNLSAISKLRRQNRENEHSTSCCQQTGMLSLS